MRDGSRGMRTVTSDLLKRMYDIALCNDPGQEVLATVCHHLSGLGYVMETPNRSSGNHEFTEHEKSFGKRVLPENIPQGWVPCTREWLRAGGVCADAPRVWCPEQTNHYHPPVTATTDPG